MNDSHSLFTGDQKTREAFSLFSRAAEQGHAGAMYHLAKFPQFLSEPFTSPLSDEEAWGWAKAANEI